MGTVIGRNKYRSGGAQVRLLIVLLLVVMMKVVVMMMMMMLAALKPCSGEAPPQGSPHSSCWG